MKVVLIAVMLFAIGCTAGHPVPPEAFSKCYEQGGTPEYRSNANSTDFSCKHLKKEGI